MRKPKGYWLETQNCMNELMALAEKEKFKELPLVREFEQMGFPRKAIVKLGGRGAIAEMLKLPLKKNVYNNGEAKIPAAESWEGKPSKAFQIEKEAREKGLRYADIQKAKTLAMVGGVQI